MGASPKSKECANDRIHYFGQGRRPQLPPSTSAPGIVPNRRVLLTKARIAGGPATFRLILRPITSAPRVVSRIASSLSRHRDLRHRIMQDHAFKWIEFSLPRGLVERTHGARVARLLA